MRNATPTFTVEEVDGDYIQMKPGSPLHIARFTSERLVIAARGAHEIRASFIAITIPTT
jgi:hypothetical protein